jgi:hypothetical protein
MRGAVLLLIISIGKAYQSSLAPVSSIPLTDRPNAGCVAWQLKMDSLAQGTDAVARQCLQKTRSLLVNHGTRRTIPAAGVSRL